jgi:hypothetical protein
MSGELGDGFWYGWLSKGGIFAGGGEGGILVRMAGVGLSVEELGRLVGGAGWEEGRGMDPWRWLVRGRGRIFVGLFF